MATKQLTARIDVEVLEWVRERARQENRSVSGQVEWLLKQAMEAAVVEQARLFAGPKPTALTAIWDPVTEKAISK